MKSGWKAIDDMGIEIDDETREMTLENSIKFVRFYGINAVSKFSDNMLQLFGNEALRVIGKAIEDGYTLQKWIPCSERLPEARKEVLVTVWGRCEVASYNCASDGLQEWEFNDFSLDDEDFIDVTAWMPLPKPYEGEKE